MKKTFDLSEDVAGFIRQRRAGRARKMRLMWVSALAAAAVVAVGVGGSALNWGDPRAQAGSYAAPDKAHVKAELDEHVASNEMEISIASALEVAAGQTQVEARIENPAANHVDQKVSIALASAPDDILYESGALHPGEIVPVIDLSHPVEPGTHTAVVTFQGYDVQARVGGGGQMWGHDEFGASCSAEIPLICE